MLEHCRIGLRRSSSYVSHVTSMLLLLNCPPLFPIASPPRLCFKQQFSAKCYFHLETHCTVPSLIGCDGRFEDLSGALRFINVHLRTVPYGRRLTYLPSSKLLSRSIMLLRLHDLRVPSHHNSIKDSPVLLCDLVRHPSHYLMKLPSVSLIIPLSYFTWSPD